MKSGIEGVRMWSVDRYLDDRGSLMELFRDDMLEPEHRPVMSYVSFTNPGIMRGPHLHHGQSDLFVFFSGEFNLMLLSFADYNNFRITPTPEIYVVGEGNPTAVLVPPGVIHAYRNTSDRSSCVINCPNRLYAGWGKRYPVDEERLESDKSAMQIFLAEEEKHAVH